MANNFSARATYERSKQVLINAWKDDPQFAGNPAAVEAFVDSMRLTQSFLRMELAATITTTNYTFAVTAQQKGVAPNNTEQLLTLQDSFVVNEVGFFLGHAGSATDPTFELDTYCNIIKWTNAAAMTEWWASGVFNLRVNNEVIVPAWDLNRNFYRPQTQQQTFVAAAQTGASTNTQDQKRLAEDGFYPCEPNLLFIGSKNTIPQVILPLAFTAVDASSRVIMVVRGILAQNSTPVR